MQVRSLLAKHLRRPETVIGLFTPKRSLVRSQYRPPAQTPPSDLGRGRLTTGSDNNAGAWSPVLAISYCRRGPLRWSPDQRAGQCRRVQCGGTSRAVAAASADAPQPQPRAWPTSAIRPRQATDHRLGNCAGCSARGPRAGARQDVPAMPAGRADTRRAPRRVTAGNGRERQGTARLSPDERPTA
jgi:hypothetical protein